MLVLGIALQRTTSYRQVRCKGSFLYVYVYIYIYILKDSFNLISVPNDSYLSSNEDINQFLM